MEALGKGCVGPCKDKMEEVGLGSVGPYKDTIKEVGKGCVGSLQGGWCRDAEYPSNTVRCIKRQYGIVRCIERWYGIARWLLLCCRRSW